MIPKIIHYCWFGGNPLPKLAKKCLKSWAKYCPDYHVIRWDESSFNIDNAPAYVKEAYMSKKWAYVTDYVRLFALYNYGGIYMDTDVEVIKPLDSFLGLEAFSGFEQINSIPTGIMGSRKGYQLFKELLEAYDERHFIKADGTLDLTTNCKLITQHCLSKGLVLNNNFQTICGFALYPKDYFCPMDWLTKKIKLTSNTHTIHHFSASWHDKNVKKKYKKMRKRIKIKNFLRSIMGDRIFNTLRKTLYRNRN